MPATEGRHPARPARILGSDRIFRTRLRRKAPDDRRAIENAIRQMERDLNAPSLRVSKVGGSRTGLWEARANRSARITFTVEPGGVWLRNNCTHDQVCRRPR